MISILTRRFLQSVFVLITVVSVVFLLQNESVIDPVDDYILATLGDLPFDSDQYRKAYEAEAKYQNKNLPKFYFALVPSYFPDDIHENTFLDERLLIKKLLRISHCPTCVEIFIRDRRQLLKSDVEDLPQSDRTHLIRLSRENDFAQLDALLSRSLLSGKGSVISQKLKNLKSQWTSMKSQELSYAPPKIIWYGLNNQYHRYFADLFSGRLGKSKLDGRSAIVKIKNALKWTLSMNSIAFILAGSLGLALGLWRTKYDNHLSEKIISSILLVLFTIPVFWLGTLAVVFFTTPEYGSWTNLFPTVGIKYWYADKPIGQQILLNAGQLLLPVICMTVSSLAFVSRLMKSKFSEVASSQFMIPLRAKGLNENTLLTKHILPNGLIPFITIMTGAIPGLFAGSLVVEAIFNIPGVGKLLLDSINATDWAVVSGLVILLSIVTVLAYLLADVLYAWANPKLRSQNS